jgi:RimJ/RimL family protein N-acetyltransferase
MNLQTQFETERLTLRPLALTDTAFIIALLNSPGWIAYIGERNIRTTDDAVAYINKINSNTAIQYWVVCRKTDGAAAGLVTCIKRDYLDHPDIGFAFLPEVEGRGFAYEAASVLLKYLLHETAFTTMLATTVPENVRSIRLLEKLGLHFQREIINEGNVLRVFAISAAEAELQQLVNAFYDLFTNADGKEPQLHAINALCIPGAVIIKQEKQQQTVYNLETFVAPREKILRDGTLTGFCESEIAAETKCVNETAQRFSRYRKSGVMNGVPFEAQGTKLFHFVKTASGWRIAGLLWEDDVTAQ